MYSILLTGHSFGAARAASMDTGKAYWILSGAGILKCKAMQDYAAEAHTDWACRTSVTTAQVNCRELYRGLGKGCSLGALGHLCTVLRNKQLLHLSNMSPVKGQMRLSPLDCTSLFSELVLVKEEILCSHRDPEQPAHRLSTLAPCNAGLHELPHAHNQGFSCRVYSPFHLCRNWSDQRKSAS